jgi:hypothetical protein
METSIKVDKRTQTTPEQLETLRLAREKAKAIRSERSQVKKKVKELKEISFQKDKDLIEKMERQLQPKPQPEPESEPEPEAPKEKAKKPKKIVYVSDSSEEEIEYVKKVKPPKKAPIEEKPAPVLSRIDAQDYIRRIQNQRMRSMLFG